MRKPLAVMVTGMLLAALPVEGRDWPQWRGPFLNGSSDETDLPAQWTTTENVVWKAPLPGPGGATPIISGGRIFVSSTDRDTRDLWAICLDEKTGRQLWRRPMGAADRSFPRNNMASPSPVADGTRVIFTFGNGDLTAVDYEGRPLWQRRLEHEYGNLAHQFGFSTSPLLYKDRLYINILRRPTPYREPAAAAPLDSFLLCLDAATGNNVFRHVRPPAPGVDDETHETYSTAILFEKENTAQILVMGADCITGHDPDTGAELWRYCYGQPVQENWRTIPSLVVAGELIIAVRPKYNGVFALKTGGRGALSENDVAWRYDGPMPDCSTPLYYGGLLYLLDGIMNGKVVTCLQPKTGTQLWQGKIGGRMPWRASLTGADGRLYCVNESGEVIVLRAGPEKFDVLYRYDMKERPIQSSIAVANGRLFIRTAENLYCVGK